MRKGVLLGVAALLLAALAPLARADEACDRPSWPMYGHDLEHSFSQDPGCASVTTGNVPTLVPKWVVHAKDSVTASPTVVDGRVYVGSWDGTFYAIDAATGSTTRPEGWTFTIDDNHHVAFGRIVSSAAVDRFGPKSTKIVLFGGGATLYALHAGTGTRLASIDLDPRTPEHRAADDATGKVPTVEIESSPAVVGDDIFVGMDVHNQEGVGRTGIVKLRLVKRGARWAFVPQWKFDPETRQVYTGAAGLTEGSHSGFGCGGVWSSPAVDVDNDLVTFGTANCDNAQQAMDAQPAESWAEASWAIKASTGELVRQFTPADEFATRDAKLAEAAADDDFGASPNVLRFPGATPKDPDRTLVGHGRKSADYYVWDVATGAEVWRTKAGQAGRVSGGFAVGGFLGTPAVQVDAKGYAVRIVGATAIPLPSQTDDPAQLADQVDRMTWSVRALDPATGKVLWVHRLAGPSYGATTIANGVVFIPDTFTDTVQALDAATGLLLWTAPLIGPPASAPAVVGDSIYLGSGTRETDAEFKGARDTGIPTEDLASIAGPHPLSPLSGITAFKLAS
jgi:polyvinyl alcohol dehydrogenase (cytochrome)